VDKLQSIRNHQITIGDHEIPVSEANMEELMKLINHQK
jgi:hypothetical protein